MMTYSNITLFKLSIIILLFVSCSESNNNDEDFTGNCNGIDIPFLVEGNTWNYKLKTFGIESGEIKLTMGKCNGEGLLAERATLSYANNQTVTNTDLWKQEDGFIQTDSDNNKDYFSKIYKKNTQLSDKWTHTALEGKIVTHEVIAVDSLITVPAGTFSCTVYKYSTSTTVNESFICWNDEVGNIKEDADGFFVLELLSYSVN